MSEQQGEGSKLRFNADAEAVVQEDLAKLKGLFETDATPEVDISDLLTESQWGMVRWRFTGSPGGSFLGLDVPPDGLVVHGVTLIEPGNEMLHRFIDWAGVYTQLGLSLSWRQAIPVTDPVGGYTEPDEPD